MSKKLLAAASIVLASSFEPLAADTSDLQVVATTVASTHVTFQVENANSSPEPVRVQVSVRTASGSTETLTTAPVTVPALGLTSVTVSSSETIVAIVDDPSPVSP